MIIKRLKLVCCERWAVENDKHHSDIVIITEGERLFHADFPRESKDGRSEKKMDKELLWKLIVISCVLALQQYLFPAQLCKKKS